MWNSFFEYYDFIQSKKTNIIIVDDSIYSNIILIVTLKN
jgi:hypothetical protein